MSSLPEPVSLNEDAVYGKVTRRLIPLLFCCYIVAYLDRVNVGFAKLQMQSDLHLSDTVYGIGAGIFFIGYFFFEIPSNLLMRMADSGSSAFSRRRFLYGVAVAAAPVAFVARVQTLFGRGSDTVELEPTPAVGEQLQLTPQETAGPFFLPNSLLKADFRESGLKGVPNKISGFVLNRKGKPIGGALLDFWQ